MTDLMHAKVFTSVSSAIASLLLLSASAIASPPPTASPQTPHYSSPSEALTFQASNDGFDGQGRPQSRSSGGARGGCGDQLVALLPGADTVTHSVNTCSLPSEAYATQTLAATPTLWFYVPQHEQAIQAELVLMDENQRAIAIETVTLSPEAGIVGIPMTHPLTVNQSYRWVFSLLKTSSPSQNPTVEGSLRRVEPDPAIAQQLNAAPTERDRIALLAQQGIWHDALTELVALRQSAPTSEATLQDWQQFLGSVGLEAIADAPLLD